MMRHRFAIIGMAALAMATLLLMTQDSSAQRRGSGSRGGSGRGSWNGGSSWNGGGYYGGYRGGYYGRGYYPYYYRGYGYGNYNGYYYPRQSYYYDSTPDYSGYYDSAMPETAAPEAAPASTTAVITVSVPADAELWVQGVKMSDTGTSRRLVSPPLEPGADYEYTIRARWTERGRVIDRTRKIDIHAGDQSSVDFIRLAP